MVSKCTTGSFHWPKSVGLAHQQADERANAARTHLSELLVAVAAKNEPAMVELYHLTRAKLFGICFRICKDQSLAEDILHDVYERIWQNAGSWKLGVASPISWLAAIARNRSIDWRRRHLDREAPLDDSWDAPDDRDGPDVQIFRLWNIRWCMSRLAALDEHYRQTLTDAYLDGLTYLEIGLRDNIPVSTVKSRAQRGLRKLQIEFASLDGG